MRYLRETIPGFEFDVERPGVFTIRVPGHDRPFQSRSLCDLVSQVETWLAVESVARLLFGNPWAIDRGLKEVDSRESAS
jgi:hypothetical protein